MSLTPTVLHHWSDGKRLHVIGVFDANSGTYLQSENTAGLGSVVRWPLEVKSGSPPILVFSLLNAAIDGVSKVTAANAVFDTAGGVYYVRINTTGTTQSGNSAALAVTVPFYAIFHQFR